AGTFARRLFRSRRTGPALGPAPGRGHTCLGFRVRGARSPATQPGTSGRSNEVGLDRCGRGGVLPSMRELGHAGYADADLVAAHGKPGREEEERPALQIRARIDP